MYFIIYLICLLTLMHVHASNTVYNTKNEESMDIRDMIRRQGYVLNEYDILTKDDYVLKIFRIRKESKYKNKKNPVYLIHGLGGCCNVWLLKGNGSLAYLLANEGYEVWLFNARGTIHSQKHAKWNSSRDNEYWKFSWQEIGLYDLPASIDLTLNVTGADKVVLVAHSEGSTAAFAMVSDLEEYDSKIHLAIHLGSPVFLRDSPSKFIKATSKYHRLIMSLLDTLGWNEVVPFGAKYFADSLNYICKLETFSRVCEIAVKYSFLDPDQLDMTAIPFIFSKVPCGGSIQEVIHHWQNVYTGGFNHFDYGPQGNFKKYNSVVPPPFKLEKIKSPVALYYGRNDNFATELDIQVLAKHLRNLIVVEPIQNENWTHVDFVIARDVYNEIYIKIISLIKRF